MPLEVYAFKNNDDSLYKSSSGGAFWAIIEACFAECKENAVIYGAAFDDELKVMHKAAYTKEECQCFRGSKYVKSSIRNAYEKIEENIKHGKCVLFSGTPCQVAALKTRLNNKGIDTSGLYLVDLICHGTPKANVWEDYKNWIEKKYKSKITEVSFRDKSNQNTKYSIKLMLENGKVLNNNLEVSMFTRLFLRRYIMEDGCYKCPFANLNRQGDITLGDFWGIEAVMPEFPKAGGVSLVLVNSDKGKKLIDKVRENAAEHECHIKKCISDGYITYQNNLQKPAEKPKSLDKFRKEYKEKGFEYIIKKYAGYGLLDRIKYSIKSIMKR